MTTKWNDYEGSGHHLSFMQFSDFDDVHYLVTDNEQEFRYEHENEAVLKLSELVKQYNAIEV